MTYFGFLLQFVMLPCLVLGLLLWLSTRLGRDHPKRFAGQPLAWSIVGLVFIAVLYTTPWDNYLVATRVWWYDPALVTNIVIGYVPIEEYTFFVVQTVMTSLWILLLMRWLPVSTKPDWKSSNWRVGATAVIGVIWLLAVLSPLVLGEPATYLMLELGWALPPIMLQTAFGADILWRHRWLVLAGILPTTLYLSFGDALAIGSGTWTINPEQSLNLFIGGVLPIEEFIFFLLTNTLVVFGLTLLLAEESQARIRDEIMPWVRQRLGRDLTQSATH